MILHAKHHSISRFSKIDISHSMNIFETMAYLPNCYNARVELHPESSVMALLITDLIVVNE